MGADKPMTLLTKVVFWFVAFNALARGGVLLLFFNRTDALFFWTINPPLIAALFGVLYLGGVVDDFLVEEIITPTIYNLPFSDDMEAPEDNCTG